MTIPWQHVEKQLQDHRKEAGWKGGPCLKIRLRTGEKYLIYKVIDWSDVCLTALAFLPEETFDDSVARFTLLAIDPAEIYLYEAYEPEQRGAEQLKRLAFQQRDRAAKTEKK